MLKNGFIIVYKVLCVLTAVLIVAGNIYYFITSNIYLATRPCVFMYAMELVILAGAAVFFAASAVPGRVKVNAKRNISAALIKWSIIVCACFSVMNAFFLIRIEYSDKLATLISDDMQKLLLMFFYLALLKFALKPGHASRMAAIIIGCVFVVYTLFLNTCFYQNALNIRVLSMAAAVAVWVLALAGFTNIKRSYYASPISKTDLYVVERFETKAGAKCAIVKSGFEGDIGAFFYDTQQICMMDSPYGIPETFVDEADQDAWLSAVKLVKKEENDSREGIL